jgi:hypothetical protein
MVSYIQHIVKFLLSALDPYVYDYTKNGAGDKQKSYKSMRMNMFVVWDKMKPDIVNIRDLNLAEVKLTTVLVTKLPL